jgi:ribonuclease G
MSKEMFISSSPHETKLAVVEDDQLVEVYFERDTDVGLVGGIYKGRVSRVLPGMQSAFVDIGLERDAFLYVSDFFFEDQEDYDKILEEAEACAVSLTGEPGQPAAASPGEPGSQEAASQAAAPAPPASLLPGATGPAQAPPEGQPVETLIPETAATPAAGVTAADSASPGAPGEAREQSRFGPRGRRWRHRGRKFGEHRPGEHKFVPRQESSAPHEFEILPGETLAKYSHAAPEPPEPALKEGVPALQEAVEAETLEQAESVSAAEIVAAESEPQAPSPAQASSWATDRPEAGYSPGTGIPQVSVAPPVAPAPEMAGPADAGLKGDATSLAAAPAGEGLGPSAETKAAEESAQPISPAPSLESEVQPAAAPQETAQPAGGVPEPASPAPSQEMHQVPGEAQPVQGGTAETPGAPSEGTYTLREPHQRPRFAPRRGRRGRRGQGYQGRSESRQESRPGNNQPVLISKVLKEGQEILVQISKEPLGTKGARITSHIALPGRYLVYMPTVDHIGVSRKISSEEERLRLRNIILENKGSLTGGFIVRTAGQGRDEEELKADLKFLSTLWNEIRTKTERAKAPALIHRDLDLVQRVLRDTLTPDFKGVRVDNETDYERVLDFVNRSQPSLIGKVKLYTRGTPLFEEFGIQAEIEKALKPKVWLKSGGYIVINQTEALVAIDVNTGKYVGKTNRLEDTILKTNFDAVNEIVRQIRLRDLGGIIVIDFIDMDERKNRAKVTQALEEALRKDRAPTKVIAFHDFGLVAITRKRVKQSLERTLCERCSYCSGSGWVKSPTTVCYEILAEARKMASQIESKVMTLRLNPEVAKALKSRDGALVSELESLTHKDVIIKSDPLVEQERFEIF